MNLNPQKPSLETSQRLTKTIASEGKSHRFGALPSSRKQRFLPSGQPYVKQPIRFIRAPSRTNDAPPYFVSVLLLVNAPSVFGLISIVSPSAPRIPFARSCLHRVCMWVCEVRCARSLLLFPRTPVRFPRSATARVFQNVPLQPNARRLCPDLQAGRCGWRRCWQVRYHHPIHSGIFSSKLNIAISHCSHPPASPSPGQQLPCQHPCVSWRETSSIWCCCIAR